MTTKPRKVYAIYDTTLHTYTIDETNRFRPQDGCDAIITNNYGHASSAKLSCYSDTPKEAFERALQKNRETESLYQDKADKARNARETIENILKHESWEQENGQP